MRPAAPRRLPSYRDFVDAALFHPRWGYYSTGRIRFGEGGHYETFPLALAPLFGRLVAARAFRCWTRLGRPSRFELCELGAGNGQLCLDALAHVVARARRTGAWRAFDRALRYRIVERSPALVARQRAQLGAVAARVTWVRADLSRARRPPRLGAAGLVIANEVLDCLAHHKIRRPAGRPPEVVFVAATAAGRPLSLDAVGERLARGERVRFREVGRPLAAVPGLARFLATHVPEVLTGRGGPPYFACPEIATLVRNVGGLYRRAEIVWIDYGDRRAFHLRTGERRRVFAGPPRSGHSVYDAPGADDVTFMVDFDVAMAAARAAGQRVVAYGPQGLLAPRGGAGLDVDALVAEVTRYRLLGWTLGLLGLGPERAWRQGGFTWSTATARGGRLATGVRRDVEAFLGRRPGLFRLLSLSVGSGSRSRAR